MKKEISAANNLRHSRDGSKNIYGDDWLKQLFVYFSFYDERTAQRASKQACSLFEDLMEFSWNAFSSRAIRVCVFVGAPAHVSVRMKIKEFHDSRAPTAFHAPRTMIYDF